MGGHLGYDLRLTLRGRQLRDELARRDGGMRCAYCGVEAPPERLVLEHVIPRSRGGPDGLHNRVLACYGCDDAKADRTPAEWQPGKTWSLARLNRPTRARRSTAPSTHRSRRRPPLPSERVQTPREAKLTFRPFAGLSVCLCGTIWEGDDHVCSWPTVRPSWPPFEHWLALRA